jgi:hypothetical protein
VHVVGADDLEPAFLHTLMATVDVNTSDEAIVGADFVPMRMYVTNAESYIQEIGINFGSFSYPNWNASKAFKDGSDPEAGVACNVVSDTNHIYFRNNTTSLLHQWT